MNFNYLLCTPNELDIINPLPLSSTNLFIFKNQTISFFHNTNSLFLP